MVCKDISINDIEFFIYKDGFVWGDGEHESTRNIMELICKYGVKDKTVIDIGTGTGILSVLCGKLGAKSILALDIESHSLEWARKNFKRNNVNVDVEINFLTKDIDDKADIILANLPGPIQPTNLEEVPKNLNDDGLLIISWWNTLPFEKSSQDYEILEHIVGEVYDVYVLKKK